MDVMPARLTKFLSCVLLLYLFSDDIIHNYLYLNTDISLYAHDPRVETSLALWL